MKLTLDEIKALSHGAERVEEKDGKVCLYRFTKEQEQLYKESGNDGFYKKSFTTAGIRLVFKTDSTSLFLKVNIPFATTRSYFAVDVYVNGEMAGFINNYENIDMTGNYAKKSCPLGSFEKSFNLSGGVKIVSIYMPWSVPVEIEELSIDDNSFAQAVVTDKKLLIFGDSITQGYDTLHPSKHYAVLLADLLKADAYNKAIGGEVFIPSLAKTNEDFVSEYVLVSYGSNDWSRSDIGVFRKDCREFYSILSRKYPEAKIFALTPIWRKDYKETHNCGDFSSIADYIKEVTAELDNVYCIDGFDFVPRREELFGDLTLHPNNEGFTYFIDNLYKEIKNIL